MLENIKDSRNNIKNILKCGAVTIDGKKCTQFDVVVFANQIVEVQLADGKKATKKPIFEIIFEDDEIIVINKPADMLSVATDNIKTNTLYSLVTDYVKEKNEKNRIFVVHRLDKTTSGVILFAKNEKLKHEFQNNWNDITICRGYVAVVNGKVETAEQTIESWLVETKTHMMFSSETEGDGVLAVTNIKLLKQNEKYSLLSINIETGRKNQIRVHMKDIGHPIVGDKTYGSASKILKRLALHANKLELYHPITRKVLSFETDIPTEFLALIN